MNCRQLAGIIRALTQFACGMALKAEEHIISIHTHAVINDPDKLGTTAFKFNVHLTGICINGVFQKFFDHGSRAFNYFTGRYLVG